MECSVFSPEGQMAPYRGNSGNQVLAFILEIGAIKTREWHDMHFR
jgi:hypothetical protein